MILPPSDRPRLDSTPMTVAVMVDISGFNTTGQVYHHLKPLIAADLVYEVEQAERGVLI